MNKQQETKNQHYLPKVFQRLFASRNDSNTIYAFEPKNQYEKLRVRLRSIEETGSKRFYYELSSKFLSAFEYEIKRNAIEDRYKAYENSLLSQVCSDFADADPLLPNHLTELAHLAWLLKLRNPSVLEGEFGLDMRELMDRSSQVGTRRTYSSYLEEIFKDYWDQTLNSIDAGYSSIEDRKAFTTEMLKFSLLRNSDQAGTIEYITQLLSGTAVRYKTSPDYPFVVSDNPGFTWSQKFGIHTTGFRHWEEYYFVVTPTTALVAYHPSTMPEATPRRYTTIQATRDFVDAVNYRSCESAYRFVLCNKKEQLERVRQNFIA